MTDRVPMAPKIGVRVRQIWERVNESLWFIPGAVTLFAAVAAYATVEIDRGFIDPEIVSRAWFVFDVGADGARNTLGAIAQSVITVTGVVFSVTIVALQLAATQFTPRVLRTFLSDRANQWVLAIFIGTFTYTLLVQRTVGTPIGADSGFVPSVSVTIAIVLSLISIGALIFFINHIAQSIRATSIIRHVTRDARELIEQLFPVPIGDPAAMEPTEPLPSPGDARRVVCRVAGYLQGVDEAELFSVAEHGRAMIRMEPAMGQFVLQGETLATVWLDEDEGDDGWKEMEAKIEAAFVIGSHSTLGQDLERALVELTDIAIRALSPSLNDPTTAIQCVDHLGELLALLGNRAEPARVRAGQEGRVRFIARRLSWERAIEVGFEKIRHHGARSPSVSIRMIELCGRLRSLVPPDRRPPLEHQVKEVRDAALSQIAHPTDRQRIERAVEDALRPIAA